MCHYTKFGMASTTDDAPPLLGLATASHELTRVRCPAGQQRHPQGKLDPCLFHLPLPGHRIVGARSRQQERCREQSTLSCNHDRQATSVTAASLLAGERWRWEQALARSTARAEAPQPEPVDVFSQAEPAGTSVQLPDLAPPVLGEPEVAIGPRRDELRGAVRRRDRELGDLAGESQGGGSRKRQHADEQAQEPAEQGETQ